MENNGVDSLYEPYRVDMELLTKPYSQKLTPQEFSDLSKIFVKEALAQIKARTGK